MKLEVSKIEPKEGIDVKRDVIRVNANKPEYGSIQVTNTVFETNDGFLNKRTRVGFIPGRLEDLELLVDAGTKAGTDICQVLGPHKIIVLEKSFAELDPEVDKGYRPKINPQTAEALQIGGNDVYWKTLVVSEASGKEDQRIQHDGTRQLTKKEAEVLGVVELESRKAMQS